MQEFIHPCLYPSALLRRKRHERLVSLNDSRKEQQHSYLKYTRRCTSKLRMPSAFSCPASSPVSSRSKCVFSASCRGELLSLLVVMSLAGLQLFLFSCTKSGGFLLWPGKGFPQQVLSYQCNPATNLAAVFLNHALRLQASLSGGPQDYTHFAACRKEGLAIAR